MLSIGHKYFILRVWELLSSIGHVTNIVTSLYLKNKKWKWQNHLKKKKQYEDSENVEQGSILTLPMAGTPLWAALPMKRGSPSSVSPAGKAPLGTPAPPEQGIHTGSQPHSTWRRETTELVTQNGGTT